MALKNIIITGSIGTYPTLSYGQKMYVSSTDEESFPIEEVIGSNGGSLPNLFGQTSSVDLYVNIDQKWSGYNDTQAGLVAYTESFQNEFVNGEFSGSVLTVSNGELTDPDCHQFLEVNTEEVSYSPFLYYTIVDTSYLSIFNSISSPFTSNAFLTAETSPNNGEIFILNTRLRTGGYRGGPPITNTYSINYIKINRFDKQGNDNTLSLQELTSLRINFSDIGIIEFPLLTITEYPTYYLYTTYVNGNITSVDNNILDYSVSASSTFSFPVLAGSLSGDGNITLINNYNNIIYDSLGYFDGLAGSYNPIDTPNIPISFSFSCTVTGTTPFYADVYLIKGNQVENPSNEIDVTNQGPFSSSPSTLIFTGSFTPIVGEQYKIYLGGYPSVNNYTATNVQLYFTQSEAPYSSSNLIVLEPYLTQNFYYDDCNALYGNATELEYDSKFYQVNYEGTTIPTNQQQILNNTAEIAPVKSYNYTAAAQVLPRYKGSRITSDAYNVSSIVTASLIQSSYPQYLNAKPYGYVPVNTYDTAIFEFNGGNPTIEVSKTSRVDISTIMNVDNTSSISTIQSSDVAFGEIIKEKIQLKSNPIITQYTTNEIIVPADVRVVTNDVSPTPVFMNTSYPQDWTYISSSQQDNSPRFLITGSFYKINNYIDGDDFKKIAYVYEGTINTDGCIFSIPTWLTQAFVNSNATWSNGSKLSRIKEDTYSFVIGNNPNQVNISERAWYVYKDPNSGEYSPKGSVTTQVISQSIANGISKGERWFISIYDSPFTSPINISNATPLANTFTGSLDYLNYPLEYSSAYEISSSFSMSGNILVFNFKPPLNGPDYKIHLGSSALFGGGSNYGLLLWKSPVNTNTILFNNTNLTNLGLGNIITDTSSPTIKNNLNYISKTFGSKP
jgi:hypothetical protein